MVMQARRQLKHAMMELYRELGMLLNYAIINRLGFVKILKKHDKQCGWQTQSLYMQQLKSRARFARAEGALDKQKERLERLYAVLFTGGSASSITGGGAHRHSPSAKGGGAAGGGKQRGGVGFGQGATSRQRQHSSVESAARAEAVDQLSRKVITPDP
jgi:hypothetical protein